MSQFNGLNYARTFARQPNFATTCEEAEAGRITAVNGLWDTQARIDVLAMMKHYQDALSPERSTLKMQIEAFLMTGDATADFGQTGAAFRLLFDLTSSNTICTKLRIAVGYIAYGMHRGNAQSNYVRAHLNAARALIVPTDADATCVCCRAVSPVSTFGGSRVSVGDHGGWFRQPFGSQFLCQTCIGEQHVWSPYLETWFHDNVEMVDVIGVEGPIPLNVAQQSFHVEEDEDTGEDVWYRTIPDRQRLCSYSTNPFSYNQWDARNKQNALVFGVELEMEPKDRQNAETQSNLVKLLGGSCNSGANYILKSDGSLSYGVELVTMPFTLEQHKEEKAIKWQKLLSAVNKGQARSGEGTNACGMHVHINKAALSALTIGKMLVFLNSESLSPLISTIAQRGAGSYCTRDKGKKIIDGAVQVGQNRYDIMNVSVVHPTCEIRMFKGNLRPERVFKNIEFCHALVQYCRATSIQDLSDWGNFSRWLVSKRGIYSYLVSFLAEKQAVGFRGLAVTPNEHYSPAKIEEV